MDPLVTQAHGAGDSEGARRTLGRGLYLALLLTPPLSLLWALTGPVLILLGQDPALSRAAAPYVWVQIPSILPFLAFCAMRQYLTGRGIMKPTLVVTWVANLINIVVNWALIFGKLGMPALGVTGAGIATAIARVVFFGGLLWVVFRREEHRPSLGRQARAARGLGELLRMGLPVGVQFGLEVWAFHTASLLAGLLGPSELAAHMIALNLASLTFMVPLGVSIAATTRVGNLVGAGHPLGAARAARVSLAMGAGVMLVSAVSFVTLRRVLPALYGAETDVVALAATILPIAGAFQVFDGTQVVGCGVLRGMGDTRVAAWINLLGYWALALPIGYMLAFRRGFGLPGLWWGLTIGLAAVAVALAVYVVRKGRVRDAA
jgi:MATE family multidrug resistance protein